MNSADQKTLKLLQKKKLLKKDQADDFAEKLEVKNISLEELLNKEGSLDPEKAIEVKAEVVNMPYKSLIDQKADLESLKIIPVQVAENYKVVCFNQVKDELHLGIVDPYNTKAIEAINFLAQREDLRPKFYLISEESFSQHYKQYQNLKEEVSSALKEKFEKEQEDEKLERATLSEMEEEQSGDMSDEEGLEGAPVAKMVSVIIKHAVEGNASDIHIEPLEGESRVRYRIDGVLQTSLTLPKNVHDSLIGRIKVLSKLKIDETRVPQDGRIRLRINKKRIDFRVSVMPMTNAEKVVMRILDLSKGVPALEELGHDSRSLKIIKENIKKTFGMFLISGPTGSGKSTTLASALSILNKQDVNISTLEDPIEYYIQGINQSQVKPEIDYTFASGLRSLLRQDPDILMVGEIRDVETAGLCIHSGLTGHLVLSTLHTNNAIDVIPRLFDMEVEPYLLGSTLNAVVSQRLVRKICPKCKKGTKMVKEFQEGVMKEMEDAPVSALKRRIENYKEGDDLTRFPFYKGEGCAHCGGSGYKGRIAIVEIIDITKNLQKKMMQKDRRLTLEDVKKDQEFVSMKQDGIIKSIQGTTTIEEVLRVIED